MQWAAGKGFAHVTRNLHHPHFTNNPALPRLLQAPSTATKELNSFIPEVQVGSYSFLPSLLSLISLQFS